LRIDQDDRFIIADIGGQPYKRTEQGRVPGPDGWAEPGSVVNGAGEDDIFLHKRVGILGVVVPADHIRERIVRMHLRVKGIVLFKKRPVRKRYGFEILLAEHYGSPESIRGVCPSMRRKPNGW